MHVERAPLPSSPPIVEDHKLVSIPRRPVALVLDDDVDFANTVASILADAGYDALFARTIIAARTLIEEGGVAVVLVDLDLGELRGRHLLDDLAAHPRSPPMIVVSGKPEAEEIAAEFAVPCVRKPFDVAQLISTINVACTFGIRPFRKTSSTRRRAVIDDEPSPAAGAEGSESPKPPRRG